MDNKDEQQFLHSEKDVVKFSSLLHSVRFEVIDTVNGQEPEIDERLIKSVSKISTELLKGLPPNVRLDLILKYPPVAKMQGEKRLIIDRLWNYRLQAIFNPSCVIIEICNDYPINAFSQYMEESYIYPRIVNAAEPKSSGTRAKNKAKKAKRICPVCNDALMKPVGNARPDENGLYRIHCCGSKNNRCDFYALLTKIEYKKFVNYELPTDLWIKKTGEKCPNCGDDLYLRTVHNNDGTIVEYEKCRRHRNSITETCTYVMKVKKKRSS